MKNFSDIKAKSKIELNKQLLATFIHTAEDASRELISSRYDFQAASDDDELKSVNALAFELFTFYRTHAAFNSNIFFANTSFLTDDVQHVISDIENSDYEIFTFNEIADIFDVDTRTVSTKFFLKYDYKSNVFVIDDVHLVEYLAFFYKYADCHFFDINGYVSDTTVKNHIYRIVKNLVQKNIDNYVNHIFETLKFECYSHLKADVNKIHLRNGTLTLKDNQFDFINRKEFCVNRLNVDYLPAAKPPKSFLRYLSDLLPADAIRTVQQFLGVCLIPSTRLQTALCLIGDGGEGKSVLGAVLSELFGENNVVYEHIANLDTNRFAVANLENKLLCIDDDLSEHALMNSNIFKTIVTATTKMQIERKFEQYNNVQLYARFVLFGNFALNSLYDNSDAFRRRLLNIRVNKRRTDRQDDPNLIEKLRAEKNQIFKWLLDGLNDYLATNVLYIADSIKKQSDELMLEADSVELWLQRSNNLVFSAESKCHTQILYKDYLLFCEQECVTACKTAKSFATRLKAKAEKYNIVADNNVIMDNLNFCTGRHRGFRGITIKFK